MWETCARIAKMFFRWARLSAGKPGGLRGEIWSDTREPSEGTTMKLLAKMKTGCMDLLFPPVCGSCGVRLAVGSPAKLCPDCTEQHPLPARASLPHLRHGATRPAGRPRAPLRHLPFHAPSYDLARSLVRYETAVRQLVHKLKFGGDTSVAGALADLARSARSVPFCRLSALLFRFPCIACGCGGGTQSGRGPCPAVFPGAGTGDPSRRPDPDQKYGGADGTARHRSPEKSEECLSVERFFPARPVDRLPGRRCLHHGNYG